MFTLAKQAKYWWPVEFKTPSPDRAGEFDDAGFDVQFLWLDIQQLLDIRKSAETDQDFFPQVITDFRGVKDESGGDVKFDVPTLQALTRVPLVAEALAKAFYAGREGSPAKNSPKLPESGPVAA